MAAEAPFKTEPDEWRVIDGMYPALRRFAAVVAPSDLEPDDILQEALVAVLSHHSLSDLNHPAAYLRKTMLNVSIAHNRTMARRRRALTTYAASDSASTTPGYPSDLAEVFLLPPRERAVLYLHEVEKYRYSEIGSMLGCSEAAAKKAGSRGRERLRKILQTEVAS